MMQIVITWEDNGHVNVQCDLEKKVMVYGLLEYARQLIAASEGPPTHRPGSSLFLPGVPQ